MRKMKSTRDGASGAIRGHIRLLRLGGAAGRTHFGVESQRDHVKGSLLDALATHDVDVVDLELPSEARLVPGEAWDVTATDGCRGRLRIAGEVVRTWTMRPVLRFEARPE